MILTCFSFCFLVALTTALSPSNTTNTTNSSLVETSSLQIPSTSVAAAALPTRLSPDSPGFAVANSILPSSLENALDVDKSGLPTSSSVVKIRNNSVGLVDENTAGFNPFVIELQDRRLEHKAFLLVVNVLSFIAPVAITTSYAGDIGGSVMFLLQGIQIGVPLKIASDEQTYLGSVGLLSAHVSRVMKSSTSALLVSQLQTLSQNVNDVAMAYLGQLGVKMFGKGMAVKESMVKMANGSIPVPWVFESQVDTSMKSIDSILSSGNSWYMSAQNVEVNVTAGFALTAEKGVCLHTRLGAAEGGLSDGAEIVADNQCDLDSMEDKTWAISPVTGRLILRSDYGDKCVAWKGKGATQVLAIYSVASAQCAQTNVELRQVEREAGQVEMALYDGDDLLCLSDATVSKRGKILNGIVSTKSYKKFKLFSTHNKCKSSLSFSSMIPAMLNKQATGGVGGTRATPALTFSEIGVQIYYFSYFASLHLTSLKEVYLHGSLKSWAKSQYYIKAAEYQEWIKVFGPVFQAYARFAGIEKAASEQVEKLRRFGEGLAKVNLDYTPVSVILE